MNLEIIFGGLVAIVIALMGIGTTLLISSLYFEFIWFVFSDRRKNLGKNLIELLKK